MKAFGNIVCFRNLEKETNNTITRFGNKQAGSVVLLKNFESYHHSYNENAKHYEGYVELVSNIDSLYSESSIEYLHKDIETFDTRKGVE